jgi:phospholipase C
MIAENDYALGQIVDLISHSSIWDSSLILVLEDDTQDGADHVDAHRMPALAISPYAKKGAVVHTRYDMLSFIRTLQIPIGMKPLGLADALAVPLYDAFDGTAQNTDAYAAIAPNIPIDERNTASSAGAAASKRMNFRALDSMPQHDLDTVLWKSVHGAGAVPPPPGPNAAYEHALDGD